MVITVAIDAAGGGGVCESLGLGVSAGFPGEEHVLQHLKPELQLRSKNFLGSACLEVPVTKMPALQGWG